MVAPRGAAQATPGPHRGGALGFEPLAERLGGSFSDGTGRFAGASASYDATVHSTIIAVDGPIATLAVDAVGVGRLSWR